MEYAQARMQARHGARPDEAVWQRLGGQAGFDAYLAAARATSLAGWLAGIGERAGPHEIELALRLRWREAVHEVARWMPAEWAGAVRWTALLIDLPARAWLAGGGTAPAWVEKDPALAACLAERARLSPATLETWLAAWRRRWPAADGDEAADEDARLLAGFAAGVDAHMRRFAELPAAAAAESRRALARDAVRWFRRGAQSPAAAFAYLLLLALDLERLRAELVTRAVRRGDGS
ncbi:MAG: hypothetical protein HYU78_01015 [Rhodocyclales bacterium]|nr:hypothetical protein [Rhodocyclales bacterium]